MSQANTKSTTKPVDLLIDRQSMQVLLPGAKLKTFRNETVRLAGGRVGTHAGSTGRVYVETLDGLHTAEYFPSVCNCKWTTDEEYMDHLLADGLTEEQAEETMAELLHALGQKPY